MIIISARENEAAAAPAPAPPPAAPLFMVSLTEGIFKVLETVGCKRRRPTHPALDDLFNADADADDDAVPATMLFTLRLTGIKAFDVVVVVVSVEIICTRSL